MANLVLQSTTGGETSITADKFIGNANSADRWLTARTLELGGSVTGSATIDGSGNISINTITNHNHNDLYPSKTGQRASGTWGIDISGNADTVDGQHFHWSGQGGQPTWLWGGNDYGNMYVYNPSNFSVNYANSAGAVSGMVDKVIDCGINGAWYYRHWSSGFSECWYHRTLPAHHWNIDQPDGNLVYSANGFQEKYPITFSSRPIEIATGGSPHCKVFLLTSGNNTTTYTAIYYPSRGAIQYEPELWINIYAFGIRA